MPVRCNGTHNLLYAYFTTCGSIFVLTNMSCLYSWETTVTVYSLKAAVVHVSLFAHAWSSAPVSRLLDFVALRARLLVRLHINTENQI
jgi:hypothetical protein